MASRLSNLQSGIALGPLLFIIAVLAILAAAIAAGSGGFNGNTRNESAKALAGAILAQADQMVMGVTRVRTDGSCYATQINFASPAGSYNNPNAPADHSCDVFSPQGGGLSNYYLPAGSYDKTVTVSSDWQNNGLNMFGVWFFPVPGCISGVGYAGLDVQSCGDSINYQSLAAIAPFLTKDVCIAINNILSVPNPSGVPPANEGYAPTRPFNGLFNFYYWSPNAYNSASDPLYGHPAACLQDTTTNGMAQGSYFFYQVLTTGGQS